MARITSVTTSAYAARLLGEAPDLIDAIIANDDNLDDGDIITIWTGPDEAITGLTDHGIRALRDMLDDARRTPDTWRNFIEGFVQDRDVAKRHKSWKPR